MLDVNERTDKRMETAEIRFLRAIIEYRMTDHKFNDDIRRELEITDIRRVIKPSNEMANDYEGVPKSFRTESIKK
jgi:hypothetical protein